MKRVINKEKWKKLKSLYVMKSNNIVLDERSNMVYIYQIFLHKNQE
jgi:hypothetical protein